jgi:gamma-glutamylcyclotransferase (GGCT)/AIG2-like uncharacterized protein YtfP
LDRVPLFVYGTLRRGLANHHRMAGAVAAGTARVLGTLWWVRPGIPTLRPYTPVPGAPGRATAPPSIPWVEGEIYHVGPSQLAHLDDFEGFDHSPAPEYRRVMLPAWPAAAEPIPVWVYIDGRLDLERQPIPGPRFPPD